MQTMATVTDTLPSGGIIAIEKFSGRHVRDAHSELAARGADIGGLIFVLITKTTTIDGKPVTFEQLDNMKGKDVLHLQNLFSEKGTGAVSPMTKEERAAKLATLAANEKLLPSGKVATIEEFLGRHVREAQQQISLMHKAKEKSGANSESDSDGANIGTMLFVLMAMLTKLDGEGFVYEDIDDMDGYDVLALEGEFSAANFQ